jgi:hypothetical protein
MMYSGVLLVHSWVRWAVVIAGVLALLRALTGASGRRPWTAADDRAGLWFTIALDVQVLIGVYLYFVLSPFTTGALKDFGAAMRTPALRFWAVEHSFGMVLGVVLAHLGRVRLRKAEPSRRHVDPLARHSERPALAALVKRTHEHVSISGVPGRACHRDAGFAARRDRSCDDG